MSVGEYIGRHPLSDTHRNEQLSFLTRWQHMATDQVLESSSVPHGRLLKVGVNDA